MKTIFITIPSYEDPELLDTINGAIENSRYPENIYFAIALQYKNTPMPNISKYLDNPNFDFIYYDVDTRPGVNQVRHNLLKFYKNQDYFLMIDSHSTFLKNWDQMLIDQHNEIINDTKNNKIVISQGPVSIAGVLCKCYMKNVICDLEHNSKKMIIADYGHDTGSFLPRISHYRKKTNTCKDYEISLGIRAGYFFTSGDWICDVGILGGVQAIHEELILSFRTYISGWDCYEYKNISIIGHNNVEYNKLVYGEKVPIKSLTATPDGPAVMYNLKKLFLFNSGDYRIDKFSRLPEDFWEKADLVEEYKFAKNKHKSS